MARQAELDAHAQAEVLGEVITAVLDRLDLSTSARVNANELLRAELLEAADHWEARQTKMAPPDIPRSWTTTSSYRWGGAT
jgi:hypothetical protein